MATIQANTSEKVFSIKAFLGMNENPDGDTKLKMGEANAVKNWAVTRDGNLRRRPGYKTIATLGTGNVSGLWTGFVNEVEYVIAACDGKVYRLWQENVGWETVELGEMDTSQEVTMFGFSNILYLLNGKEYKQWDGETFKDVAGYRPLVAIAVPPGEGNAGETTGEYINRLCGERRLWISPDGKGTVFQIPETGLASVDYVKNLATGETVDASAYTVDLEAGTVTFSEVLPQTVDSYEIGWTVSEVFRDQVLGMRFAELYNGSQDTRVFLYGDGTNKYIYSGLDYSGIPRADYFPDLYEGAVGDANTPITSMIRHYSNLICYKSNSTYSIRYGSVTLADSTTTAGFYATPVNRSIGNAAPGQAKLVLNMPRTLFGRDVYEWKNSATYTATLTSDERQAKRISDRIWSTLGTFEVAKAYCFDDNYNQEYYICQGGKALVHNYAADAWYTYTNLPVATMMSFHDETYIGATDGTVKHFSYDYTSDDGNPIEAYWESGSMAFGMDYMRKYSAQLWIGIRPDSHGSVVVTVQTDRKSNYNEKTVESELLAFDDIDFGDWSFDVNRSPKMHRLKIKAKKFVFYKLIFKSDTDDTRATVLAADIRVRFTGNAK